MTDETVFRLIFAVVLFSTFGVSGYFRRRAREEGGTIERRSEGGWIYTVRMIVSLPLLAVLLLYLVYPGALGWASAGLTPWLRYAFGGISLLAIPMFLWIFRSIGKNVSETILTKEGHELVRVGPYRHVRHPLYGTALLLIGSLGVVAANWVMLLYFVVGWPIFRYLVIPAEEEHLISVFGEEYHAYRRETGAMVPRVFGSGK